MGLWDRVSSSWVGLRGLHRSIYFPGLANLQRLWLWWSHCFYKQDLEVFCKLEPFRAEQHASQAGSWAGGMVLNSKCLQSGPRLLIPLSLLQISLKHDRLHHTAFNFHQNHFPIFAFCCRSLHSSASCRTWSETVVTRTIVIASGRTRRGSWMTRQTTRTRRVTSSWRLWGILYFYLPEQFAWVRHQTIKYCEG